METSLKIKRNRYVVTFSTSLYSLAIDDVWNIHTSQFKYQYFLSIFDAMIYIFRYGYLTHKYRNSLIEFSSVSNNSHLGKLANEHLTPNVRHPFQLNDVSTTLQRVRGPRQSKKKKTPKRRTSTTIAFYSFTVY